MEYWIELVMKYKEIIKDITGIKKERKEFIDTFDTNKNLIYKSLMSAVAVSYTHLTLPTIYSV